MLEASTDSGPGLEGGREGESTDGRQAIGFQVEGPKVDVVPVPRRTRRVAIGGDGAERVDQLRTSRIPNGIVVTTQIHIEIGSVIVVQFGLTSTRTRSIIPLPLILRRRISERGFDHFDAQDPWCSFSIPKTAANGEFEGRR